MNVERMEALARHMEGMAAYGPTSEGSAVLMTHWRYPDGEADVCQTVGCIAGHAEALFGVRGDMATMVRAQEALDLNSSEAAELFHPDHDRLPYTGRDCARVIRVAARDDKDEMDIREAWHEIADEIDERDE